MARTQTSRQQNALSRAFAQDPKKASALSILAILMLVLWGNALMKDSGGPAKAVASTSAQSESGKLSVSGRDGEDRAHAALQEWLKPTNPATASRNLFAVKFDYFQQD